MTIKNMISEDGKQVSIGRLTFWLLLFVCLYFWLYLHADAPDTLHESWIWIMFYNLGKKILPVIDRWGERKHAVGKV